MAGGTAVILFMISDLVHKACIIGADALVASLRNRERKDPRLLLYTGIPNGIYGMHGMIMPAAAAAAAAGICIRLNPVKESVVPVVLMCLWGIAAACRLNISYNIRYNQHASLFIRKFFAAYVSLENKEKAFEEACASIPGGAVKERALSAEKQLSKGVKWNSAVGRLDDGTSGGKGLAVCLKMFGNSQQEPDPNKIDHFSELFFQDAAGIRERMHEMSNAERTLFAALLEYSAVSMYSAHSALSAGRGAVLLSAGFLLAVMVIIYRSICIRGRIV